MPSKWPHPDSFEAGDGNHGDAGHDTHTQSQVVSFMGMTGFMKKDSPLHLTISTCVGRELGDTDMEVLNQHPGFKNK